MAQRFTFKIIAELIEISAFSLTLSFCESASEQVANNDTILDHRKVIDVDDVSLIEDDYG